MDKAARTSKNLTKIWLQKLSAIFFMERAKMTSFNEKVKNVSRTSLTQYLSLI